jgi:hypothetical protein
LTVVVLPPDQAEQLVEDFARFIMAKYIPADQWPDFARNTAFRLMRLAGEKTSKSGSYRIKYEDPSKRDTIPAPVTEPSQPPKKT